MADCTHRGPTCGVVTSPSGSEAVYLCRHRSHRTATQAECAVCPHYLERRIVSPIISEPQVASIPNSMKQLHPQPDNSPCRHPHGVIVDRYGRDAGMADHFKGAVCFFVASGPSARSMPLELLSRRGCVVFCCNNSPAVLPAGIRPAIWTHTDPTHKFHDSIWRDPGIPFKLSPIRHWGDWQEEPDPIQKFRRGGKPRPIKGMRTRGSDGELQFIPGLRAKDCPGVFGYHRNTTFDPASFLTEPTINRGNDKKSHQRNGWPNTINTMFSVLRLAYYLGFATLYLIGCDFSMDATQPYAFDQAKDSGGIAGNNNAFRSMAMMFLALAPRFEAAGFQVFNCTPGSKLGVFDTLPFTDAIDHATTGFEQELNCDGWYDPIEHCRKRETIA